MEDDMDDLDLLWCTGCQTCHGLDCPTLGPAIQVSDTPLQSRAVATLPANLMLQTDKNGMKQVIAKQIVANRTQFGPVEAPVAETDVSMESAQSLLLKVFQKDGSSVTLDLTDENKCNWMCLVRPATNTDHQNLIAYQYKSALYYSAMQDIDTGVELRAWYAPHYAPRVQQTLLTASSKSSVESGSDNELSDNLMMDTVDDDGDDDDDGYCKIALRKSRDTVKPKTSLASDSEPMVMRTRSWQKAKENNKMASGKTTLTPDKRGKDRTNTKPTTRRSRRLHQTSSCSNDVVDSKEQNKSKTTCPICRKKFCKEDFTSHMAEHGSTDPEVKQCLVSNSFKCNTCALSFYKEEHLQKHNAICLGDKDEENKKSMPQTQDKKEPSNLVRGRRKRGRPPNKTKEDVLKHACKECNCQFSNFSLLRKHLKTHKPTKVKKKLFKSRQECLANKRQDQNSEGNVVKGHRSSRRKQEVLKCRECAQCFKNETLLCKHLLKVHDIRQYSCKYCPKIFARKMSLQSHTLTHMKVVTDSNGMKSVILIMEPREGLFKCTKCTCVFQKWDRLKKHMENLHRDITVYCCDVCCTMHDSKTELESHMEGHERTELPELESLHECDVCKSLLLTPSKLRRHKDQHDDRRDHVCEICGKAFGRTDTLSRHKEKHKSKCVTSVCVKCGKTFHNAASLTIHMRLHQDKTGFVCSQCGKTFSQLGNYNQHLLTHAQQRQFKCEDCGSAFNHAQALKRHRYTHMEKTDKLHKCDYCGARFYEKYALVKHTQDMHLGKRSCYCEHCGLYIKRVESYYRHMRRRHTHIQFKDYKPVKATGWPATVDRPQKEGEMDARKEEKEEQENKLEQQENSIKLGAHQGDEEEEESREKQDSQFEPEVTKSSQPLESECTETNNGFSQDGELLRALTKLKQTISKVTSNNPPQNTDKSFPLSLYKSDSEVLLSDTEVQSAGIKRDEKEEHAEEENPGLFLVVESHDSPPETAVSNDKSEPSDPQDVIVQNENQVVDPNLLIVNLANVDTLITLGASSVEDETSSSVTTSAGQTLVPVSGEQILVPESCQTLSPTVEDTMTSSVSPGPMLGNQSLISISNETGAPQKQVTSSAITFATSAPKSTPVNSFISIESLLSLPPSTSSSIPNSDPLPSSLATQSTTTWQQQSSSSHGNSHNSHFMQGVKFDAPAPPPKQMTNFSNVSSLAMPSTSSGIRRSINNPLVELQPAGQSVELSFLSKPISDSSNLKNLQQSTVGMRQFVPIAPLLPHITSATMDVGSKAATHLQGINHSN